MAAPRRWVFFMVRSVLGTAFCARKLFVSVCLRLIVFACFFSLFVTREGLCRCECCDYSRFVCVMLRERGLVVHMLACSVVCLLLSVFVSVGSSFLLFCSCCLVRLGLFSFPPSPLRSLLLSLLSPFFRFPLPPHVTCK